MASNSVQRISSRPLQLMGVKVMDTWVASGSSSGGAVAGAGIRLGPEIPLECPDGIYRNPPAGKPERFEMS